jgi:hypothetical protein
MLRLLALLFFAAVSGMSYAANDWVNLLAQDPTGGLVTGHVCYTTNGHDLSCDGGAPVITSGTLYVATSISSTNGYFGTVSATTYYGDGSHLSGVAATDRIVSGSTSMLAISNTSYISITQAGTNTGWFDPTLGLVTIGVSSTGPISGTNGFFSGNVGIGYAAPTPAGMKLSVNGAVNAVSYLVNSNLGFLQAGATSTNLQLWAVNQLELSVGQNQRSLILSFGNRLGVGGNVAAPSASLHVSGTVLTTSWTGINFSSASNVTPTAPLEVSGTVSATRFVGNGSGLTGISNQGDRIASGTTSMVAQTASNIISITTNNVNTGYFNSNGVLTVPGISATSNLTSVTSLYASGSVGIGVTTPSVTLDVRNAVATRDAARFFVTGQADGGISVGGNGSPPGNQGIYANGSDLYLLAGSTQVLRMTAGGGVGITTGLPAGRFDVEGSGLIYLNSGNVGIGIGTSNPPSTTLQVSGTTRLTSWTAVNENVTPTTPLEVSGTVSATRFVGDGSGLTGISTQGDRIASGTTSMVANSATGIISITTAGNPNGYFNSNGVLTAPGISATANLTSVTSLYASGAVGIGTTQPSATLNVYNATGGLVSRFSAGNAGLSIYADDATATFTGTANTVTLNASRINAGASTKLRLAGQTGIEFAVDANTVQMTISSTGNVGIGTSNPNAKLDVVGTISATAIQVKPYAVTCASGISGTMRYSTISATMEYCNGAAWTSMGPSVTQPVSFFANTNSTQSLTGGSFVKLACNNKVFDTNNNYDTTAYRYTPTVPGKYLFGAAFVAETGSDQEAIVISIQKNGVRTAEGVARHSGAASMGAQATAIIDMNGTTDYVEVYALTESVTSALDGAAYQNYFEGVLLSPQGGGAGGSATPAGSTNDVQFNSGGSLGADTGKFTYSSGLLTAPNISGSTISGTNVYAGSVSGTTGTFGAIGVGNINASGQITATAIGATLISATGTTGTVSATYGYFKYISASTGLGAGTIASLTDVSETGVAAGMLLRYNGTKWESVSASTALSTTTMLQNWPDAIYCDDSGQYIFYLTVNGSGVVTYRGLNDTTTYLQYNSTTGAFSSSSNVNGTCRTSALSISQLYAQGRAFNFIGSSLASANTAANGVQWNNNGVLGADLNFTYNSGTAVVSTGTISATNVYAKSISGTTGTFGGIGSGLINATGISITTNQTSVTTLYASGNVGIGTASPANPLEVSGTMVVDGRSAAYNSIFDYGSTGDVYIRAGTAGGVIVIGDQNTGQVQMTGPGSKIMHGNVGIDNDSPNAALDVIGTISATAIVLIGNSGITVSATSGNNTAGTFRGIGSANGINVFAGAGGGSSNGGIYAQASSGINSYAWIGRNDGYGIWCQGTACGGNVAWSPASDGRLKDRITPLPEASGLAAIEKLRPVTYHWRDVNRDKTEGAQIGFIAQEVEPVFPSLVVHPLGDSSTTITLANNKKDYIHGPLALRYETLVAPLVKAVQELKALFDADHAALQALKAENDNLHAELKSSEAANDNEAAQIKNLTARLDAFEAAHH